MRILYHYIFEVGVYLIVYLIVTMTNRQNQIDGVILELGDYQGGNLTLSGLNIARWLGALMFPFKYYYI